MKTYYTDKDIEKLACEKELDCIDNIEWWKNIIPTYSLSTNFILSHKHILINKENFCSPLIFHQSLSDEVVIEIIEEHKEKNRNIIDSLVSSQIINPDILWDYRDIFGEWQLMCLVRQQNIDSKMLMYIYSKFGTKTSIIERNIKENFQINTLEDKISQLTKNKDVKVDNCFDEYYCKVLNTSHILFCKPGYLHQNINGKISSNLVYFIYNNKIVDIHNFKKELRFDNSILNLRRNIINLDRNVRNTGEHQMFLCKIYYKDMIDKNRTKAITPLFELNGYDFIYRIKSL